jgi:hypothetical protein
MGCDFRSGRGRDFFAGEKERPAPLTKSIKGRKRQGECKAVKMLRDCYSCE